MTDDEVFHAMSMVFPDVRLKSYVEIRPADSMPIPYVLAYAALIKGLFYGKSSLETLVRAARAFPNPMSPRPKTPLWSRATTPRCISARRLRFAMSLSRSHAAACRRPSGASSILLPNWWRAA